MQIKLSHTSSQHKYQLPYLVNNDYGKTIIIVQLGTKVVKSLSGRRQRVNCNWKIIV
jgi:hypothetical protein